MASGRSFLVRGLLAGLLAGVAAFAVAYAVGEPPLRAALAIEAGGGAHEDLVPRSLQATAGLLTGTLVAGATLGGLVGVLSALAVGRFGWLGPRGTALATAGVGFVAAYGVPFLAYPANPPGVGREDTIGPRTALYVTALTISIICATTTILAGRRLAARWGGWYAGLAAVAGYLLVTGTAVALLPRYNEVPAEFPATVLYDFRVASFLTELTLWAVLGVALAELTSRLVRQSPTPGGPAAPRPRAVSGPP